MPFLSLNDNWSSLASLYNQNFNNKPELPSDKYNSFDDGLIRGGLLNAGLSSVRDTARIGKFFISGRGVSFLTKQVGLQLSNPQLEQLSGSTNTLSDNNTRLYNLGRNTLAQVPVNAFGGHIIRHGITPIGGIGFLKGDSKGNINGYNYEQIVLKNNDKGNNRLVGYLDKISNAPIGTTPTTLLSYNGGASSVYGIGNTEIKTTTLKTDLKTDKDFRNFLSYNGLKGYFDNYKNIVSTGYLDNISNVITNTSNNLINTFILRNNLQSNSFSSGEGVDDFNYNKPESVLVDKLNSDVNKLEKEYNDLKKVKEENFGVNKNVDFSIYNHKSYITTNIQSRIGVGTSKYGPNNTKLSSSIDSINAINVVNSQVFYSNSQKSNTDADIPTYALNNKDKEISGNFGQDIIKFRIEFLNNDTPNVSVNNIKTLNTDVLAFRAYLDDFNDGMNAKWNSYRYMGRGEEFYVYEGFTRDISVAFTLHAHSDAEMKPIYQKLNYLMSTFAPDYSSSNKMRGNIGYLTVGDYLYRQPGIFTDIKLTGMLDTGWEIGINPDGTLGNEQYEVPKHIKVALSFKPIHTFLPRKTKYENGESKINAPFITPDRKAYPTNEGKNTTNKYLD